MRHPLIWFVLAIFATLMPNKVAFASEWGGIGVPFANFTADKGIGYGVFGSLYSKRQKPNKIPYDIAFTGQFYQTTGRYAFHKLNLDYPRQTWRFVFNGGWENWENAPYFGNGALSVRDLSQTEEHYEIELSSLWLQPQLRFDIWQQLEGLVLITVRDASVVNRENLLSQLKPKGYRGGRLLTTAFGVTLDTRDNEPTPNGGYWLEMSTSIGHPSIGSEFETLALNLTHRHWWSLHPTHRFVLASRTMLDLQKGSPFFQLSAFNGSQLVETGGHSLLRGLDTGRVRAPRKAAQTIELHTRFAPTKIFGKSHAPMVVVFGELVHLSEYDSSFWSPNALLYSTGLGGRVVIDNAFVVRIDYGIARERVRRQNGKTEWRFGQGSYVIIGHSF